jgi:predicted membrane-bound mannosyltransferase
MYIHESLLVLFGMLALVSLTRAPRYGIAGLLIGLMFATKESFAISMIAWTGAGVLVAAEKRENFDFAVWLARWREFRVQIGWSILAAGIVAGYYYTDGFRQPRGAVDAIRTFFVYETVEGHDKPFGYYFELLALPFKSGGFWWFGTPVVALALIAFGNTFRHGVQGRATIRFLGYAAVGHFLIYSLIAYKTPWLACLPWAHVCLLAGFSFAGFSGHRRWQKGALCLLAGACIVSQFIQTRRATGRLASDERNPFAYVPTRGHVETLAPWLEELQQIAPSGTLEPVAVVGADYWPLPWYLRLFDKIGYWKNPTADLRSLSLVFSMPETEQAVMDLLQQTHTPLPRGLRAGVPVTLFVKNDLWNRWMEKKE